MKIAKVAANIGLYTAGVILSCGISQVYGLIKGVVDLIKKAHFHHRLAHLKQSQPAKERWSELKRANAIKCLEDLIRENKKSLKVDLISLIPIVGTLFAWRVLAPKEVARSPDALQGIPYAASHLLADFRPLFLKNYYPLRTPLRGEPKPLKYSLLPPDGADHVEIPVLVRGESLEALHLKHPKQEGESARPTMVIFHGNLGSAKSHFYDLGLVYHRKGFDVLLPTMGGYPGSRGGTKTSEVTSYQDVEAIRQFLVKSGVKKVAYHGYSIGSTLAFQASTVSSSHTTSLETCFVVAQTPLSNGEQVAQNMIRNAGLPALAPLAKGIGMAALPKRRKVQIAHGEWVETDGVDNLSKAKKLKELNIPLFCIHATRDKLMSRARPQFGGRDFAIDLIEARYGERETHTHLIVLQGGKHVSRLFEVHPPESDRFLELIGALMPELVPAADS